MKKTLIKLISRIMGHRALEFNGSQLNLLNVPMVVLHYQFLAKLQSELITRFSQEEVKSIIFNVGKSQGFMGTNIFEVKYNIQSNINDLTFYLELGKLLGFGEFNLQEINDKKKSGIMKNDSQFAKYYKKTIGIPKIGVDFYISGLVTGGIQYVTKGSDMVCFEHSCMAKGDEICIYDIKKKSACSQEEKKNYLLPESEVVLNNRKIYTMKALLEPIQFNKKETETWLSQYLKKKNKDSIFKLDNDGLKIIGIDGLITPMIAFACIMNALETKFGSSVNTLVYNTAKDLGEDISRKLIVDLKLKKTSSALQILLEMIGFFGFGKPKLISCNCDNGKLSIKLTHNSYPIKYARLFGWQNKAVDYYAAGYFSGCVKALLGKEILIKEKSCFLFNKSSCSFES